MAAQREGATDWRAAAEAAAAPPKGEVEGSSRPFGAAVGDGWCASVAPPTGGMGWAVAAEAARAAPRWSVVSGVEAPSSEVGMRQ